jgi:DUF971 family protein
MKLEHVAVIGSEIALVFSEDKEVYLQLDHLRRACPCAVCQGEPDAIGRVVKPTIEYDPNSFELVKFEIIGKYALQLFWADGHSSGIYGYDYLNKLNSVGLR